MLTMTLFISTKNHFPHIAGQYSKGIIILSFLFVGISSFSKNESLSFHLKNAKDPDEVLSLAARSRKSLVYNELYRANLSVSLTRCLFVSTKLKIHFPSPSRGVGIIDCYQSLLLVDKITPVPLENG